MNKSSHSLAFFCPDVFLNCCLSCLKLDLISRPSRSSHQILYDPATHRCVLHFKRLRSARKVGPVFLHLVNLSFSSRIDPSGPGEKRRKDVRSWIGNATHQSGSGLILAPNTTRHLALRTDGRQKPHMTKCKMWPAWSSKKLLIYHPSWQQTVCGDPRSGKCEKADEGQSEERKGRGKRKGRGGGGTMEKDVRRRAWWIRTQGGGRRRGQREEGKGFDGWVGAKLWAKERVRWRANDWHLRFRNRMPLVKNYSVEPIPRDRSSGEARTGDREFGLRSERTASTIRHFEFEACIETANLTQEAKFIPNYFTSADTLFCVALSLTWKQDCGKCIVAGIRHLSELWF